jgi:hypothetical protein
VIPACPLMQKIHIVVMGAVLLSSCSPRDFLTRRLAGDLIARSNSFRNPQQFQLNTGILPNQEYLSPDYSALQHHGWISGTATKCAATLDPPCWDVILTPIGVDTFQSLIGPGHAESQSFTIPAARRELVAVTGIAKQGNSADVEFIWRWVPLNEVGAALYSSDQHHKSMAGFLKYDDGWRLVQNTWRSGQSLDEGLNNAERVSVKR